MNFYVENKSFSFVKKAYNAVVKNTNKTVFKAFVINYKGGFNKRQYKFFKKKGIYDVEYVISGVRGLRAAVKYLRLPKNPISLTLLIDKPLSEKSKSILLKAKKTVKIIDITNSSENIAFYKSFNKILYKTKEEDTILEADIMHLYKFYETVFQCNFSSCLGKNLYVDKSGSVHFCPNNLSESTVGTIFGNEKYLSSPLFDETLQNAIKKREKCKKECKYFDYCMGACPLKEGCSDFVNLFEKGSKFIDEIVDNEKDLSSLNYAVAKIIIKDRVYGE